MNAFDLLRSKVAPCLDRMDTPPFWGCDLPAGHAGDHVSLHANPWTNKPQ